jgi:ribosomal protein L9
MALTPEDVLNKNFTPTQFRRGYDEREVDDFLDEVVAEMRRLVKESDELRDQLNECREGRGMAPVAKPDAQAEARKAAAAKASEEKVAAEAADRLAAIKAQAEEADKAAQERIAAAAKRAEAQERALAQATAAARESAEALNRTVLTIPHQAGDDGRLFGSVTSQDIVDAIQEARGITIDRRKVNLEEPIRTVGTRMIEVEVEDGVIATVKTMVVEQK